MGELELRFAGASDLEQVGNLLAQLDGKLFPERFPGKTVTDFCRWKYLESPLGKGHVAMAVSGGEVVSLSAAVPKRMRISGQEHLVFELGDFITAPSWRRKGLFSKLIEMLCTASRESGAALVYVRPNESSFPILANKLGFHEFQQVDERRLVVPSAALSRKTGLPRSILKATGMDAMAQAVLVPAANGLRIERLERFGAETDELWARTKGDFAGALVRDSKFLNWRYVDHPGPFKIWLARRGGEAAGYLVSFQNRAEPLGWVLDLYTGKDDREASAALLSQAARAMLSDGMRAIYSWTVRPAEPSASGASLRRACPVVGEPYLHVAMKILDSGALKASDIPQRGWHLALGDFDGF